MGFFKTLFSSSELDWWRCIIVNTQGLPPNILHVSIFMTLGSCVAIQKSVNLLRVCSLLFTTPPIQSTPLLRYDTPRIQPSLIRSRYYVRNAKRVVASLRVSHVVVEANERQLYSQAAGAITSKKQILMMRNESFSVAKYFTF